MILFQDQIVEKSSIHISPDDRGYNFGDGVYEMFRVYKGELFAKEAHFARLIRTAEAVQIQLPYSIELLEEKLNSLLQVEKIIEGTVYLQITRGAAPRAHAFPLKSEPVVYAHCNEVKRPVHIMKQGITVKIVADIRWLRCDLKTLNLLPNVLAKQEALDAGADEAILHRDGLVTECSLSNVMMVKDGVLHTHPANNLILHGVTRAIVLALARELELPILEEPFTLDALRSADEVFITGTTVEVTPVVAIDQQKVADGVIGPITERLQEAFELKFLS
ncbi:D-amino-acid transaminase [Paenibacillus psychroresistens]|uniref:D-alanine aminotransferase n=1 Tax=Paenibacillus psychroresistens TaxID=1778678 RepID=A0A6B8RPY8_9BACL|nr:D-amino-acid transaminase [Paenibacillus psychroresistens]QGQ97368.1 D-amino-acid transaminase [Paenibacillus psychroresistens]